MSILSRKSGLEHVLRCSTWTYCGNKNFHEGPDGNDSILQVEQSSPDSVCCNNCTTQFLCFNWGKSSQAFVMFLEIHWSYHSSSSSFCFQVMKDLVKCMKIFALSSNNSFSMFGHMAGYIWVICHHRLCESLCVRQDSQWNKESIYYAGAIVSFVFGGRKIPMVSARGCCFTFLSCSNQQQWAFPSIIGELF